jgi:hypothetical protein
MPIAMFVSAVSKPKATTLHIGLFLFRRVVQPQYQRSPMMAVGESGERVNSR